MSFNENTYLRIKKLLILDQIDFVEKKMFGGLVFMINDKMCFGVMNNQIMLRVLEEHYDSLLNENNFHPMNFTGRTMKGLLFIDELAFKNDVELLQILNYGIEFSVKGIVKSKKKKKQ